MAGDTPARAGPVLEPAGARDAVAGWSQVLGRLFRREDLTASEAAAALDSVLAGEASATLVAAFLAALRTKGETVEEISGLARAMRQS